MSNSLEYTDEEIYSLLRHLMANEKPDVATETTPEESSPKSRPRESAAGLGRELSIEEILKKMEAEMADSRIPSVPIR